MRNDGDLGDGDSQDFEALWYGRQRRERAYWRTLGYVPYRRKAGVPMTDHARAIARLEEARTVQGLIREHRTILCDLIAAEIEGNLAGCYPDIPIQVYHHPLCPGYSSTMVKRIVQHSYAHWFRERDQRTFSLRFGSAFHTFVNEPHLFSRDYFISSAKTRRDREFKDDRMIAGGKIILTAEEFRALEIMTTKLHEHPDASPLLDGAQNEITAFVQDEETGLWMRCRVDILKGRILSDLKSTRSAELESFTRDSRKLLYGLSAAFYMNIFTQLTKVSHRDFYLIACESDDPYEIAVYKVSDASIYKAEAKIRDGLNTIRKILDDGDSAWLGYRLGIQEIAI